MIARLSSFLLPLACFASKGQAQSQRKNNSATDVEAIINRGIDALGGLDNIQAINSVTYTGNTILRSKTIMLAISLGGLDQFGVTSGRQNITFSFDQSHVKQRIDKFAQLGPNFSFGRASLDPMDFSLLIEGGDDGFAAVVQGSYDMYNPGGEPSGYTDGRTLGQLHDQRGLQVGSASAGKGKFSSALSLRPIQDDGLTFDVFQVLEHQNATYRVEKTVAGTEFPTVYDGTTGLAVLLDPDTHLPHIIRSYEDHPFFGPSTNDLLVYNYAEVDGVQFPQRFKTIYNGRQVVADFVADQVSTNVEGIEESFARPGNGTVPQSSAPIRDPEYSFAEIGEMAAVFLWPGAYSGTVEAMDAVATQPYQDVPGLWILNEALRQAVIELEDGSVIVLDAPPHQSKVVIEWVRQKLGKNVTHVWPTHHHHDHAFGVVDYVAAGAKIIIPEHAVEYYSNLNLTQGQAVTYKRGGSITLKDTKTQLTLVDMQATLHAVDHGYAVIQPACVTANSSTSVFEADHANQDFINTFDHGLIQELTDALNRDRVPLSAHLFPVHGADGNLTAFIDPLGAKYPSYSPLDFVHGESSC
ncbi:hypothetical protein F66182_974 [Fusarium sp. NRRL 66182]|nr:hypothetical protein F66182_974 [Fusarium sp. NRRL 66182]